MKTLLILFMSIIFHIIIFSGCTEDSSVITPEPVISVVGTWNFSIPAYPPMIPDTTTLQLMFEPDSSFQIDIYQPHDIILFNSSGAYSTANDSVNLISERCVLLDTLTNTLKPISEVACATPIVLPFPQSNSTWEAKASNFSVALSALPIPANIFEPILSSNQDIPLTHKK